MIFLLKKGLSFSIRIQQVALNGCRNSSVNFYLLRPGCRPFNPFFSDAFKDFTRLFLYAAGGFKRTDRLNSRIGKTERCRCHFTQYLVGLIELPAFIRYG